MSCRLLESYQHILYKVSPPQSVILVSYQHSQVPGANYSAQNVTKIKYTIFTEKYLAQYSTSNRKLCKNRKKLIIFCFQQDIVRDTF